MAQLPRKAAAPEAPGWFGGLHPTGDATSGLCRLSFNPQLRVEFRGATVTSDAGLLLPRELDERLALIALIERPSPILARDHCREPLAESPLASRLFGQILWRIERLAWHPT